MKIVAISDTHGETDTIQIPACDLLLHAGDICKDGNRKIWFRHFPGMSMQWFRDVWMPWMQPMLEDGWVKQVLLTWGNHDWTDRIETEKFNQEDPRVQFLIDREVEVNGVRIWGTPWSNEFNHWAWMKRPWDLKPHYDNIPEGVDIIMSHQPPIGGPTLAEFSPQTQEFEPTELGSVQLKDTIDRVKPKAVIAGHLHFQGGTTWQQGSTKVYNVACLNEQYQVVRGATEVRV